MKKTNKRFTRKIAAMLAAVMMMTTMAAITASANDAENSEIISAVKANPDLRATWEDVEHNDNNEDEIDQISDLLERLEIDGNIYNDKDANEYTDNKGDLTHDQVLEIIRNAHPNGCIKNPYSMNNGGFDYDDDDDETAFTEDDWNGTEEEDDSDSIYNLNFGDGLMDELLKNMF